MAQERDETFSVLRDIWHAREQTGEQLDAVLGSGKACKAMKHVGFGGQNEPVDDDLRAAWRAKLEREGKRGSGTVADLLAERDRS